MSKINACSILSLNPDNHFYSHQGEKKGIRSLSFPFHDTCKDLGKWHSCGESQTQILIQILYLYNAGIRQITKVLLLWLFPHKI